MSSASKNLLLAAGLFLAGREIWGRLRETNLRGQIVLITGGSRGLGLALGHEFARHGCRLALCARDEAELARAQAELEAGGADVLAVSCDLANPSHIQSLIENVTQRYGRIDILVNNAGIIEVGPAQNMTRADFEAAIATDFWGTLDPILAVLPQMRQRRSGRIVNVTSIGGKVSFPHLLPYNCAKFAAVGLSEGLRAELARDGIKVTTIVPGLLRTGSYLRADFKGRQEGEFAWFGLGDNLPGLSISAERAAREIVRATRRGEAERILSLPANALAALHGLLPGFTADLLGLVNQAALPPPDDSTEGERKETGTAVHSRLPARPLFDALTALGIAASQRLNQK